MLCWAKSYRGRRLSLPISTFPLNLPQPFYCQENYGNPPAQGTSKGGNGYCITLKVSILAPAQGASPCHVHHVKSPTGFNSRPRTGGIESPLASPRSCHCFNSRPRTGGITARQSIMDSLQKFQFSPPHRGHPITTLTFWTIGQFQFSPPHRGHRRYHTVLPIVSRVSILAPAQGASPASPLRASPPWFQFSPPHRGHR